MSANLSKPFAESCCDGGATDGSMSAQPCGCDPGADWICQRHRDEMDTKYSIVYSDPLERHLHEVINKCWNYAGRLKTKEDHLLNAVMGLVGEAGEVADNVKKQLFHDKKDDNFHRAKRLHEYGDVAFYFRKCLEIDGFTLEEVLVANREKLESRHPEMGKVKERFGDGYIK